MQFNREYKYHSQKIRKNNKFLCCFLFVLLVCVKKKKCMCTSIRPSPAKNCSWLLTCCIIIDIHPHPHTRAPLIHMRPVTMLLVFVQVGTSKRKMCIAKPEFSFHYAVQEHVNEAQMLQIENIHWNSTTKLGCRSTNVKVGIRSVCGVESHTHHVAAVGGLSE